MLKLCLKLSFLIVLLISGSVYAQDNDLHTSDFLTAPNEENGTTEILVGLFVTQITDFDERNENFSIEAIMQLTWHDSRQAFDGEAAGTDSKSFIEVEVVQLQRLGLIWFPELYITTEQGKKVIESQALEIFADGRVVYRERFGATIQNPTIDFHEFPFDDQVLQIPIESLIHPIDEVTLLVDSEFTGLGNQLGIDDWLIGEFETYIVTITEEWAHEEFSRFIYSMPATRRIEYYVFTVVVPLLMILLIAWSTFFLPDFDRRIDATMGTMLLVIAFQFTLNDGLPDLSYLTFFDFVMFITFFLTAFAVFINIYGKWLIEHDRVERGQQIAAVLLWLFPMLFVGAIGGAAFLFFAV